MSVVFGSPMFRLPVCPLSFYRSFWRMIADCGDDEYIEFMCVWVFVDVFGCLWVCVGVCLCSWSVVVACMMFVWLDTVAQCVL